MDRLLGILTRMIIMAGSIATWANDFIVKKKCGACAKCASLPVTTKGEVGMEV